MSLFDTITGSLCGDVYAPGRWRPLSLGSFFSEGWLESWAAAPAAGQDDLTPRHGWLGAFNGLFYRLWLSTLSYSDSLNKPYHGNSYAGSYDVFLPLSRRFEIDLVVPFVASNGTLAPGRGYVSEFGDSCSPDRETAGHDILALDILIPRAPGPRRGAEIRVLVQPGRTVGRSRRLRHLRPVERGPGPFGHGIHGRPGRRPPLRPHDVPFGDLVFYAATNWKVPLDGTSKTGTYFGVGPGTRFHIAKNFFFLHYWEFPLTGPHPDSYTMEVALLKVF